MELQLDSKQLTKFAADKSINNIISRQNTEKTFELKSIPNIELENISKKMNEFHEVSNIFGRRSSSFSRINLTLNHITPYQNLKQCTAEIESRRLALKDNYFKLKKNIIKLKRLKYRTTQSKLEFDFDFQLIQIEIEELEASIIDSRLYIEGALKEIAIFQQAYSEIVEAFNIENWDEKDFEEAEAEYQIKRCFQQCFRDIIESRTIRSDNQEWLEQLGINPMSIITEITEALNNTDTDYNHIIDRIDNMYKLYKNHYKKRLEQKGIKNTYNKQIIYRRD